MKHCNNFLAGSETASIGKVCVAQFPANYNNSLNSIGHRLQGMSKSSSFFKSWIDDDVCLVLCKLWVSIILGRAHEHLKGSFYCFYITGCDRAILLAR